MFDAPKRIAIIGAGQLGSRHLQGLKGIKQNILITVIDRNPSALEIARKRYFKLPDPPPFIQSIAFLDSIDQLVDVVDLAIVATNADIRREVIETLVKKTKVKYLLLEKVVFQSVKDFEEVIPFLEERFVKAWVNCTRRMYPFFEELKKRTINCSKISLFVEGYNWGLASNTIHMLDLLAFLTEQTKFEVDVSNLLPEVYESKREGFIELGGEIRAETKRGDKLVLVDKKDIQIPFKIHIKFEGVAIEIDQSHGLSLEFPSNNLRQPIEKQFQVPLQSELTGKLAEQILQTGFSQLTSLKESYQFHIPLLKAFNYHISRITKKQADVCPIT